MIGHVSTPIYLHLMMVYVSMFCLNLNHGLSIGINQTWWPYFDGLAHTWTKMRESLQHIASSLACNDG
jgi:hypothetical protein